MSRQSKAKFEQINNSSQYETTDKVLDFSKHINKLWRNAQNKLHALRQIRKYLGLKKTKYIVSQYIHSQLNFVLLIWALFRKRLYLKLILYKTLKVIINQLNILSSFLN